MITDENKNCITSRTEETMLMLCLQIHFSRHSVSRVSPDTVSPKIETCVLSISRTRAIKGNAFPSSKSTSPGLSHQPLSESSIMTFPQCLIHNASKDLVDEFKAEGALTFKDIIDAVKARFPDHADETLWDFKVKIGGFSTDEVNPMIIPVIDMYLPSKGESAVFDITITTLTAPLTLETAFTDDIFDIPYNKHSITIGCFIPEDVPTKPADRLPIDLDFFPAHERTKGLALMFALIYYEINYAKTSELANNTALAHVFREGHITEKTTDRPCINIVSSEEQSGKTVMCVETSVLSLFVGKRPFISLRNIGGDTSMVGFKRSLKRYCQAIEKFLLDQGLPQERVAIFKTIQMMTIAEFNDVCNDTPVIVFERTNSAQLKRVYNSLVGKFNSPPQNHIVFIKDEADEDLVSPTGDSGASEGAQFNAVYGTNNATLLQLCFMTFYVTATPQAIVMASSTNKCNFEFTLTSVKPCPRYVGFETPNRKVHVHVVGGRRRFNRNGPPEVPEPEFPVPPTLKRNFDSHAVGVATTMIRALSKWLFHPVSVLVAIPDVSGNGDKSKMVVSVVSDYPQIPIVGFSSDCEDRNTFWFNGAHFGAIDIEKIKKHMEDNFDVSCDITLGDNSLTVNFRGINTTNNLYDIAHLIYKYSESASHFNPFVVCVAYKHAGRSVSFKDSNHTTPLTHYYYGLPKTKGAQHLTNVSQGICRACSVDDAPFDREVITSEEARDLASDSRAFRRELAELIRDRRVSWDVIKREIDEETTPTIFKYLGNTMKRNATKSKLEECPRRDVITEHNRRNALRAEAEATTRLNSVNNSVSVDVIAYRQAFERDLEKAYTETAHMTNIYEKIDVWKTMELDAESSKRQSLPSHRKSWVTLCCLLITSDGVRRSFHRSSFDELIQDPQLEGQVLSTLWDLYNFRDSSSTGNNWRPWCGQKHLHREGDMYYLWSRQ